MSEDDFERVRIESANALSDRVRKDQTAARMPVDADSLQLLSNKVRA